MNPEEIIGKKITDIFVWSRMEVGGLDEADVYIELENTFIIDIPSSLSGSIWIREIDKKVISVFADLSDHLIYHLNKEEKSIKEVMEAKKKRSLSLYGRIRNRLGIGETIPREYKPFKVEHRENKLRYIKDQAISDLLIFKDSTDKGFIELENGYVITETIMAPHGTGLAGLNYYTSLHNLEERHGSDYTRLTDLIKK